MSSRHVLYLRRIPDDDDEDDCKVGAVVASTATEEASTSYVVPVLSDIGKVLLEDIMEETGDDPNKLVEKGWNVYIN